MTTNTLANECLAALSFVSGVNHYSTRYFLWQAEHDMAVATFTEACRELRLLDNDPASRGDKYDEYLLQMDKAIIDATNTHYPMGENNSRVDPDAAKAPVFKPVVVADNDIPHEEPEAGDGGSTLAIEGEGADQQAEPIAAAG